tara:strand:+ start:2197 stop:5001 length:2805 start_codon:yes stop_codon:yes gene_type:complete
MAGTQQENLGAEGQIQEFPSVLFESPDHLEPVNQPRIDEVSTTYEEIQKAGLAEAISAARDVVVGMGEMEGIVVRIDSAFANNEGQAGSTHNPGTVASEDLQQRVRVKITSHRLNQQTGQPNPRSVHEHFLIDQYHSFVADPGIPLMQIGDRVGVVFGDNVSGAHGKVVRVSTAGPDRRPTGMMGGSPPMAQNGFGWGGWCGQAVSTPANQTMARAAGTSKPSVNVSEAAKKIQAPTGVFKPSTGANKKCLIIGDDHAVLNIGKTWEAYYKYNGWQVKRLGARGSSVLNWVKGDTVKGKNLKNLMQEAIDFKPEIMVVKLGGNGGFGQGADKVVSGVQNVTNFINKVASKSPNLRTYWLGIYFNPNDQKKPAKNRKAAQVLADQGNAVFANLVPTNFGKITYIDGASRHDELTPSFPHHKSHPEPEVAVELVSNWVRIIDANEKGAPFQLAKPTVNKAKEVEEKLQEAAAEKSLPSFEPAGAQEGTPLTEKEKQEINQAIESGATTVGGVGSAIESASPKVVHVQAQPCPPGGVGPSAIGGPGAGHPSGLSGGNAGATAKIRGPKMGRKDGKPVTDFAVANNMKYFGRADGRTHSAGINYKGKVIFSTANKNRRHGKIISSVIGHLPYAPGIRTYDDEKDVKKYCKDAYARGAKICTLKGTFRSPGKKRKQKYPGDKGARVSWEWQKENLMRAPGIKLLNKNPIRLHKLCVPYFERAVAECQARFGFPIISAGGFFTKGTPGGFSAHAWGVAVDFDSDVTPFTPGGMLDLNKQKAVLRGGTEKNPDRYRIFWDFKNSRGGQTYKNYLEGTVARKEQAVSLYEFIAGPYNTSEIGRIFAKYGIRWGAHFGFNKPKAKKDTMHFEWMPPAGMSGMVKATIAGGKVAEFDPSAVQEVEQQNEQLASAGVGISSMSGEGGDQLSTVSTEAAMSVEPGA